MKKLFLLLLVLSLTIVLSGCVRKTEEIQFDTDEHEYLMDSYDFCMSLGSFEVVLVQSCTQHFALHFNNWNSAAEDEDKITNENWLIWKSGD